MLSDRSRYRHAGGYEPNEDGVTPFKGTRPRAAVTLAGVVEHRVVSGDRLDRLALQYYADARKWYLILDANPELVHAAALDRGDLINEVILIPAAHEGGT